jgi:hypothetical protein
MPLYNVRQKIPVGFCLFDMQVYLALNNCHLPGMETATCAGNSNRWQKGANYRHCNMKVFVINIFHLLLLTSPSLPSPHSLQGPFSLPASQGECKHFTKNMQSVVIKDTM